MAIHRLGLRFTLLFKSSAPSLGRWTLINKQLALFPSNSRQFTTRVGLATFWRRARVQQAFRIASSAIPARSARTLRRGLLPGSIAYHAGKSGEANVERSIPGPSVSAPAAGKVTAPSFRTTRKRRLSTKENLRRAKESAESSQKSNKPSSNEPAAKQKTGLPEEESHSYFHRPSKEQLLATATSVFSRLHIRFKWPLIRSLRPFNIDDISAFISVYLLSHAFLLIAGTTTFFLFLIAAINTVGAQEYFAQVVGWYLTKESGMTIVFESAIVPKWQSKTIRFERVFVSRRPAGAHGNYVRKGSSVTAAAAAAAAAETDKDQNVEVIADDGNYTQFDLTIESVDVTLSFVKWMNGKGLVENVAVRGVRGVVGIRSYMTLLT
jgi:Yeast mitochondrial distribution and morphology (MDM) proteins